jgi:P27 family predicted phage terminase small subunit
VRGKIPTPIAIHRAQGTYRADRHGNTPEPKPAIPKAPAWLDKEGKKLWRYFAPRLAEVRVVTELDQQCLAIYCSAAARLAKGEAAIAEKGEVVKSPAGFAQPNPWIGIIQKCQEVMLRYGQELGLSPASRTRIKVAPAKPSRRVMNFSRYTLPMEAAQ